MHQLTVSGMTGAGDEACRINISRRNRNGTDQVHAVLPMIGMLAIGGATMDILVTEAIDIVQLETGMVMTADWEEVLTMSTTRRSSSKDEER